MGQHSKRFALDGRSSVCSFGSVLTAALVCIGCKQLALSSWLGLAFAPDHKVGGRVATPLAQQLGAIRFRWCARDHGDGKSAAHCHCKKQQQGPRKMLDVGARCTHHQWRVAWVPAFDFGNLYRAWMAWAIGVTASRHGMASATRWTALAAITFPGWVATAPVVHASNSLCAVDSTNLMERNPPSRTISRHGLKK